MSLDKSQILSPLDFITLKNRVKAEMQRRNGYGSLTTYASTAYDYTEVPTKSNNPKLEHYSKIRDVMANINSTTVSLGAKAKSDITESMTVLEANMTVFEAKPRGSRTGNDCSTNCSGTCVSTCDTGCSGCDGCSGCGGCDTGCDGCSGCGSGCNGCTGCGSGCADACVLQCADDCTTQCDGECYGTCYAIGN